MRGMSSIPCIAGWREFQTAAWMATAPRMMAIPEGALKPMSARMGMEVGSIWRTIRPVMSYSNAVPRYLEFSSILAGSDLSHLGSVLRDMSSRVSA